MPTHIDPPTSCIASLSSSVFKGAVCTLLLVLSPISFSQAASTSQPPIPQLGTAATVRGVVERTLLTHPGIQAEFHKFQAALDGQAAARAAFFPSINATAAYSHERRHAAPGAIAQKSEGFGHGLELRQLIFDGFRTRNDVKQAGFEKLARFYDVLATSDETAFAAVQAYVDVQRHRHLETLARQNLALHDDTWAQIELRVRSGVGRRVDLEQASGRRALARSNLMTATANLADVQQRFLRLTGMLPAVFLEPVPDVAGRLPVRPSNFNEALRRNPGLLSRQATLQATQASLASSKGAFSPTVELVAATGRGQSAFHSRQHEASSSSVQVLLRHNLYNGGADSARVRQTTALSYAARDNRDYTCRNAQQELAIAWNNIVSLSEKMPFLREHEAAISKVRDAYRQQFQIGQRSLMDLLDTENELFDARRALANSVHDVTLARYRWLSLSHDLLPALSLQSQPGDVPEENSMLEMPEEAIGNCLSSVPTLAQPEEVHAQYNGGASPPKLLPMKPLDTQR